MKQVKTVEMNSDNKRMLLKAKKRIVRAQKSPAVTGDGKYNQPLRRYMTKRGKQLFDERQLFDQMKQGKTVEINSDNKRTMLKAKKRIV